MRKVLTATLAAASMAAAALPAVAQKPHDDRWPTLPPTVGIALLAAVKADAGRTGEDRNAQEAERVLATQRHGRHPDTRGPETPVVERDQPYFRIIPVPRSERDRHEPERHAHRDDDRWDKDRWHRDGDHWKTYRHDRGRWDRHDHRHDDRWHPRDHRHSRQPLHSHGSGRWAIWHRHPYGNGPHRHSRY